MGSGTYYNQEGLITTREDVLQLVGSGRTYYNQRNQPFTTKNVVRGVWWSTWCPGPEGSRGNAGCNKSSLGSRFCLRGWELDRNWYISPCIDASMGLPIAWSLRRPAWNPQPDECVFCMISWLIRRLLLRAGIRFLRIVCVCGGIGCWATSIALRRINTYPFLKLYVGVCSNQGPT